MNLPNKAIRSHRAGPVPIMELSQKQFSQSLNNCVYETKRFKWRQSQRLRASLAVIKEPISEKRHIIVLSHCRLQMHFLFIKISTTSWVYAIEEGTAEKSVHNSPFVYSDSERQRKYRFILKRMGIFVGLSRLLVGSLPRHHQYHFHFLQKYCFPLKF